MLSNVETTRYQPRIHMEYKNYVRGKTAVIVGDSSGIGLATAALLSSYGARVFFAAQSSDELAYAFATVAQDGGQWDGTVVDLQQSSDVRRLFILASSRLGKIDLFVQPLPLEASEADIPFLREILQHMNRGGHIVQVRLGQIMKTITNTSEQVRTAALRHDARAQGVHLTRIEPSAGDYRDLSYSLNSLDAVQVAQYVYESLSQPFGVDVVFLPGQI